VIKRQAAPPTVANVPREAQAQHIAELDENRLLGDEDHALFEEVELSLDGLEVALDDVLAGGRGEGGRCGDAALGEGFEDLGDDLEGGGFVFLLEGVLLEVVAKER
jgi:hypothetical protein